MNKSVNEWIKIKKKSKNLFQNKIIRKKKKSKLTKNQTMEGNWSNFISKKM